MAMRVFLLQQNLLDMHETIVPMFASLRIGLHKLRNDVDSPDLMSENSLVYMTWRYGIGQ